MTIARSIAQRLGAAALAYMLVAVATAALAEEHGHWSYRGGTGPSHWGALEQEFGTCSLGKYQSPIDIKSSSVEKMDLDAIKFDYKPSALRIINTGHSIQVNYDEGSNITVGAKQYQLVQFHFHRPSEEKIDGKAFDMVVHLVHKGSDGKLAVVAVLVHSGHANPLVATLWSHLPKDVGKEHVVEGTQIDAAKLLPSNKAYYTFTGSLTTPPCSEEVTWFVLRNPVQFSGQEVARFAKIYPMNARPVQPLNGRKIEASR
jgi:carbonic anhydrase